ncbi:MAG: glycosyltransferase family 2 protein [Candidatus Heimdallarchaeota archaeon]|nr:glycosyltransferase family 2 protein [Candidatus Heimdallarchaeota archaeon]
MLTKLLTKDTKIRLFLRPLSKYSFIVLVASSFFHLVWLIGDRNFGEDLSNLVRIKTNIDISVLLWSILFAIIIIELINVATVNHTAGILAEEEIATLLEPEIRTEETLVLIPALNEEQSIEKAIKIAQETGKVLVIDDGSTDNTLDVALQNADFVITHRNKLGLASTVANGIEFGLEKSFKQFVIFDADCQYTGKDLKRVATLLQNSSFDMIMGSRLKGTIEQMKLSKRIGNYVFSKALTYITRIPISDAQTGLRAFTDKFALSIKLRGDFTYTQEMLFEASQNNFSIAEIPIEFKKREFGESRLMTGPVNYALRAWALNLQILAEYNPLKFAVVQAGLILTISFIALSQSASVRSTSIILIISSLAIMIELGIFASITIRKLASINVGKRYNISKE